MKRFLSAFIAILLVVSMMPLSAFAADAPDSGPVAKVGDTVYPTLADAIKAAPENTSTTISLLKNCTIANTMAGHKYVQNITIDLNGYTLSSSGIALTAYRNGTTLTVKNGTVLGNSSSGTLRATYGGKLILGEGLTVKGAGGSATLVYVDNGSAEIAENAAVKFVGGKVSGEGDFKVSGNVNNKLNIAAKIGRTYFGSFANAYKTAVADDTIVLLKPIVIAKGETLKLDKKVTITYASSTQAHEAMITNNGTLIVDGAELIYTYTGTGDPNFGWGSYTIYNNGNLTVNSGKVEFVGNQPFATHCSLAIFQYAGSTTINGGSIINNAYRSVRLWKGDMTINGGTFEGQVWVHCVDDSAKLTINGGSFAPAKNGGDGSSVFVNNSGKKAELFVTGGSFATKIGANDPDALNGPITGGTFTEAAKNGTNAALLGENMKFEANENGTYGVVAAPVVNYVAQIGEEGFETLADAFAAAQDGDTITLIRDVTMSDTLVIDKAITLDGNSKTLTSTAGRAINVSGANGVTIKNLTINCSGERAINIIQNATNVTIENVTATAANYTVNVAASAPNAVVAIKNSTLNGLCTVNVAAAGAKVTVDNSTVNCNDNNTSAGESYAALCLNKAAVGGSIVATNSIINVTEGSDSEKGRNGAENSTVTINGSTEGVTVTVAVITYAGSDNYYGFKTLAEAIEFAKTGDTITLIRDIAVSETIIVDKSITLNLNGKTITGTDNATGSFAIITNKGELTITGNGTITLKATNNRGWNAYSSVISNQPGGKLIVESGTIEHLGGTDMAYGIDNLTNGKGTYAETIINGGTIKSTYRAIRMFLNGIEAQNILTVKGGVIEGANKAIWMQDPSKNANTGKLTVTQGATINGDVYLTVTEGSTQWPVEVSIAAFSVNGEVLTSNVPAGYEVANKNGIYGVVEVLKGSGIASDPYQIGSVEDLVMFRDSVNAGETKYNAAGMYFVLTADIDLAGINWVGIGSMNAAHGFMGNFDGNDFKIMNLTITDPALDSDGYAYAGLFSVTEGTDKDLQNIIKNLTIENVSISTTGHIVAAAIAYPYYTIVENVTVCGVINITGGDYTAGALAYTRRCVNASKVTVSGEAGSTITGRYTVGGVISDIQMNGGLTANYSNFAASGLTITGEKSVGGIAGIISSQAIDGVHVENVTLVCGDERVGTVAGSLGGSSTIMNVSVNNVTIKRTENDTTGSGSDIGGDYDTGADVAAKIGNTYYKTLADALAAVKTGETIVLLNDVTLTDEDAVVTSAGVKAMLNISGKSITLDLNGKTLYLENNSAELIYAGIFVDKNAALTIKDSVGNGGVRAEKVKELANGKQDIGYMILNYSTTHGVQNLVIEGGNFYAKNVEDSIVYSQGNETTVIKGGSFVLDAVGTRANGHPWIFNAKGQNTQHILVEGGSFNADVAHQYWIFEVEMSQYKALKYEDGMYKVVGAVAYVTEQHWSGKWYTQNIGYATLEEAIAACQGPQTKIYYGKEYVSAPEKVVVLKNITLYKTVTIPTGKSVIIDLGGLYTISGTFSNSGNQEMFLVKGNLTVKNGNIEMTATNNQGWNAMSTVFDVTAGGVLNIDKTFVEHQGGTDMNFCVHLNNWGEVTLNVTNNSTLKATYIPVRVFNSGNDMNNVTIKNTTLNGKYCFWVHNYTLADFGTQEKVDAHKALLNFNFYGAENGNTFAYTNAKAPVIYGFTDEIYFDANGSRVVDSAEDLKDAFENGDGNITLGGDIDLNDLIGSFGG